MSLTEIYKNLCKNPYIYKVKFLLLLFANYSKKYVNRKDIKKIVKNITNYIFLQKYEYFNTFSIGEFGPIIYKLYKNGILEYILDDIMSWKYITIENLCEGFIVLIDEFDIVCKYLDRLENPKLFIKSALEEKSKIGEDITKYERLLNRYS